MPKNPLAAIAFVSCILALNFVATCVALRRTGSSHSSLVRPPFRRPKRNFGVGVLIWQIDLLFFLFLLHDHDSWSSTSIGLKSSLSLWNSLGIGFAAYLFFYGAYAAALRQTPWFTYVADQTFYTLAALLPRSHRDKVAALTAFCLLNPIIEEVMFRGILIHQLGVYTGSVLFALAIGFIASMINHAYQGIAMIAFHALFYVVAVTLLYSSAGLAGAVGFHFAGDWFPFLLLGREIPNYRARRRKKRLP